METTGERGFRVFDVFCADERYQQEVTVKESSADREDTRCAWVFIEGGPEGHGRNLHLDLRGATRLRDALTAFLGTE